MFLFGYIENTKGVSYPLIKADFGISWEEQGVLVSVLSFSYVLFCLAGGIFLGSFGVRKAFIAGFIFMIAGLVGVFILRGFLPAAAALFVVSASFGLFEVSMNALATQVFITRTALLMNILNFFYGAGSIFSPRAAGTIAAALGWRSAYLFSIPLVLLFFVISLFTRFPHPEEREQENTGTKKVSFLTAVRTPMVWKFSLVLGLMMAVEIGSVNWGGLYFQEVYHLDPKTRGAAFISNFYILFTLSRLLSGFAIEKIGYLRSLFIAALAAVFIFILGIVLGPGGVDILPGLGIFAAIFWPTLMAVAMGYFRGDAPVMTSAIIVIAGTLNSGIQLLIGFINRLAGPAWGYRSNLFYALLVVGGLIMLSRCMRRPYKA